MKRTEYCTVDKSRWPRGPWNLEPDKIQWPDQATGLPCLIVRGPSGALCGYVGVPREHPLHGKDYDDCPADVHGGLTFSGACQKNVGESHGICHVPGPGEPDDVWWFGFDCAHSDDFCPEYPGILGHGTYRSISYVTAECRELAKQLENLNVSTT